jgi:hypothetical protein
MFVYGGVEVEHGSFREFRMRKDMDELMRSCRAWARGERCYKQALQKWEQKRDLDRSHT